MYSILIYNDNMYTNVISFFKQVFKENGRTLDLYKKDNDITKITEEYINNGNFWCAFNEKNKIIGTIALRQKENFFEIRRFFILKKYKHNGLGQKLLCNLIRFAISSNIKLLRVATMYECNEAQHIFEKFGFIKTKKYSNSTADIFYKLIMDVKYIYNFELSLLNNSFEHSLILNPTENIPMYSENVPCDFFEGLYVSERLKDVNDKVIFAGRNDYIKFFEIIKQEWKKRLHAYDVDLKTLSGLNAHLILFLCIAKKSQTIMLLPEECGGHFSTTQILENLGCNVIHMTSDNENLKVNIEETKKTIEKCKPNYIFVDRSEGLNYEDFSWLAEYDFAYKIFDASQYLSQVLTGYYKNPFDMGFNMIISTLHKNYPGPQKGIIAVKEFDDIWEDYLKNAKTYISNTHPMAIAKSLMPLIDDAKFNMYSDLTIKCHNELQRLLDEKGVPVVKRKTKYPSTLHIWILCSSKEKSYEYYLKLEQLNILTNYRLLPYNLGYGLRVGVNGAVRMGLKIKHIQELASIMAEVYYGPVTSKLEKRAKILINKILSTGE